MKLATRCLSLTALTIICALGSVLALGQGSNVKIIATFDHPVHVGQGQVLQPGQYTFFIEQDQTDRPVFRVQSPEGKNLTLTSSTFDARSLGQPVSSDDSARSSILLENVNGGYYLHRVTLRGQDRGFQFTLPENVKDKVNESTHVIVPVSAGNAQ